MAVDGRGSDSQRRFYDLLKEIYPIYDIVYEYAIGEIEQRIDLFIPVLGIAVEYNGIQHYQFSSFFHKDETDWNKGIMLDKKKTQYLKDNGVKLVVIPYNTKIKTAEELKEFIDSIPYPEVEYTGLETKSNQQKHVEKKQKDFQKTLKESYRNSKEYENHKEHVKAQRKLKYQELKEKHKK